MRQRHGPGVGTDGGDGRTALAEPALHEPGDRPSDGGERVADRRANCRNPALPGCERQLDVLDMATGSTRYRGTSAQLSGLGDIVSGAAVVDGLLVVGDGVSAPPEFGNPYAPFFPMTATVRALKAQIGAYLPAIER